MIVHQQFQQYSTPIVPTISNEVQITPKVDGGITATSSTNDSTPIVPTISNEVQITPKVDDGITATSGTNDSTPIVSSVNDSIQETSKVSDGIIFDLNAENSSSTESSVNNNIQEPPIVSDNVTFIPNTQKNVSFLPKDETIVSFLPDNDINQIPENVEIGSIMNKEIQESDQKISPSSSSVEEDDYIFVNEPPVLIQSNPGLFTNNSTSLQNVAANNETVIENPDAEPPMINFGTNDFLSDFVKKEDGD